MILPPDGSETDDLYWIHLSSCSKPAWEWTEPSNFHYDHIDLTINYKSKVTVLFPALTCKRGSKEDAFSKTLLKDLITADSEAASDTVTPEQIDELFTFILSVGEGTLPRPKHLPYSLESPYQASFTHFCLGGGFVPVLGMIVLTTGTLLLLVGRSKKEGVSTIRNQKRSTRRVSIVVAALLVNYGVFFFGVFLIRFADYTGRIDDFLYTTTSVVGTLLIPISIAYSFVRRFASKIGQWDFFDVYLSVLFYFVMMLFLRTPPWMDIIHLIRNSLDIFPL